MTARHLPVMVREVLDGLSIRPWGVYLDATVGPGGHSGRILEHLDSRGKLICSDRDEETMAKARAVLGDSRCVFVHSRFSQIGARLRELGIDRIDGALFDCGVSMLQLKEEGRGFGFDSDAPLDMRMDPTDETSAADIVNTWSEREIADVIFKYGEESRSRRVAAAIVKRRSQEGPFVSCRELSDTVSRALGGRRGRTNPATRTFQGLRIAVNNELEEIGMGLQQAMELMGPGGRLVAISYHSLEDRVIKHFIKDRAGEGQMKILTKKPILPEMAEQRENPSSRSAKLRVGEVI